ncbi:MAG TPA: exonuclease sbcCD subunit D, partial [Candidatus Rifleibacterium sp.]|nr:exonuclease sbcCD subunit D [Candidatus Rifleibacterium sp.]
KLLQGIREHYARVCTVAEELCKNNGEIPLIATGHLFTQGGQVSEDDGVRELYVGTLAHAPTDVFPATIDYLALGHLHVAQKVGGKNHLRYCGSPIAMGFGEAGQVFPVDRAAPVGQQAGSRQHMRASAQAADRDAAIVFLA